MVRVITNTERTHVGVCIYCDSTKDLTDEHVSPYALNGRLILAKASCKDCAKITGGLEQNVLRKMFFAARAAMGMSTRNPRDRAKPQPMLVKKDGVLQKKFLTWQDQWKVIELPIFPVPACIDGRPYQNGIVQVSRDRFELSERGEEIAKKHGVEEVIHPDYRPEDFARFIAKMAIGYAVERYTLNAFQEIYVRECILGTKDDVGKWVGCSDVRELPVRPNSTIRVAFRMFPDNDALVKLKMFAQFDGAEYITIVGKLKPLYADWVRAKWRDG